MMDTRNLKDKSKHKSVKTQQASDKTVVSDKVTANKNEVLKSK